ncbi:unnamed protein product [Darwinula stevensoni]|uniref:WD repeat-containing protein 20 n=1 Tax=Darwinula stevensoni TaxID=69355 RepID=A0A7R8ZZT1_9CRUS|nr:unnamed protein product [Darwinula stevensoni]CAG0884371.1 unnamed protein product [Darwinula stevensoni]
MSRGTREQGRTLKNRMREWPGVKMAVQLEGGGKEEIKSQFTTREGAYKNLTLSEYSRPNRVTYSAQPSTPVRVSFVTVPSASSNDRDREGSDEKICFNAGRELFVYPYKGIRKAADLTKPIDKRAYKGTNPTCHDFNSVTVTPDSVMLLVGFSGGQIQLIDPIKKDVSKLYNEDRSVDKTKVTCLRWLHGSPNQFLVSHGSGQLYLYHEELPCGNAAPQYQLFKQGDGYSVYICKTKSTRNPLYRWVIGEGSINEFAFSPCSKYLAVVSQDGFLRVFNFDTMELIGVARSFFGGLLCVCWSPDGKYVVTGGEDDLVTVWGFHEKRVICRGQGHKSWVNVVAFDSHTTTYETNDLSDGDETGENGVAKSCERKVACYRFSSVGQDTYLCLWDLTDDILKRPFGKCRTTSSSLICNSSNTSLNKPSVKESNSVHPSGETKESVNLVDGPTGSSLTQKLSSFALGGSGDHAKKKVSSNHTSGSEKNAVIKNRSTWYDQDPMRVIGTPACPRLDECPLLDALVCKKISYERLTAIVFKEDCLVTACQDGIVSTWARPGRGICSMEMFEIPKMPDPQRQGSRNAVDIYKWATEMSYPTGGRYSAVPPARKADLDRLIRGPELEQFWRRVISSVRPKTEAELINKNVRLKRHQKKLSGAKLRLQEEIANLQNQKAEKQEQVEYLLGNSRDIREKIEHLEVECSRIQESERNIMKNIIVLEQSKERKSKYLEKLRSLTKQIGRHTTAMKVPTESLGVSDSQARVSDEIDKICRFLDTGSPDEEQRKALEDEVQQMAFQIPSQDILRALMQHVQHSQAKLQQLLNLSQAGGDSANASLNRHEQDLSRSEVKREEALDHLLHTCSLDLQKNLAVVLQERRQLKSISEEVLEVQEKLLQHDGGNVYREYVQVCLEVAFAGGMHKALGKDMENLAREVEAQAEKRREVKEIFNKILQMQSSLLSVKKEIGKFRDMREDAAKKIPLHQAACQDMLMQVSHVELGVQANMPHLARGESLSYIWDSELVKVFHALGLSAFQSRDLLMKEFRALLKQRQEADMLHDAIVKEESNLMTTEEFPVVSVIAGFSPNDSQDEFSSILEMGKNLMDEDFVRVEDLIQKWYDPPMSKMSLNSLKVNEWTLEEWNKKFLLTLSRLKELQSKQ